MLALPGYSVLIFCKLPTAQNLEVHFITALCENVISTEAMRPGDILVASNKKTIEVLNTDAEGRLTLADALVYAEKLEPDTIIDLATLTGAVIAGLGEGIAALYSPDEALMESLKTAAGNMNENIWPMPLEESYRKSVKGTLTDLKNIAGQKGGGSITAALFLQEFVEKTPWAHIGDQSTAPLGPSLFDITAQPARSYH
jgi:leucyl aminopeptidase